MISHCNISLKDCDGNTALHLACMRTCLQQAEVKEYFDKRNVQIVETIAAVGEHCGMYSINNLSKLPVEVALESGYVKIASFLITEMYKKRDIDGNTPLHLACMKQNMNLIKLIKKLKCASSLPNKMGDTPLHVACQNGYHEVSAKLLKSMDCNMFAQNKKGKFPIQVAIQHNHLSIVHQIWGYNFSPEGRLILIKAMDGFAFQSLNFPAELLHEIVQSGIKPYFDLYALRVLKEYYTHYNPQLVDHLDKLNGYTPLHYACCYAFFDVVVYLINEYKADVNARNREGYTLLHLISRSMRDYSPFTTSTALEMVVFLVIKAKCDPNVTSQKEGNIPLKFLANNEYRVGHLIAHYYIFECNCDITVQNVEGNTAMHIACMTGNDLIVQMIADCDSSVALLMIKNNEGNTPLHLACCEGKLDLVNVILVKFPKKCGQYELNNNGCTPVQLAIVNNHYEVVSAVCQAMDPEQDEKRNTLLHDACKNEDVQLVQLFARSMCLNMQNEHGDTPLHIACLNRSVQLCGILLEACCDINVQNRNGDTPLHLAFSSGDFEIAQLLISDPQVKPGLKNNAGDTLLHIACKTQHCTPEMVNYVLAVVKSDPNATNNDGMTPIQLTNNAQKIHELICYGANPTDVYSTSNVKMNTKHPPQPLVKIFVVGNPSVGKSTLIAAL